ncbi:hypothetical protein C2E25_01465 [Geothermobacter hydrogeniphilus]|uniref:Competence protein ComEA n=1 Tax=Geothermobacter hydrogeniphilus TaxID=1969733 RepID=A0A2K2HE32_9BACT|nr:helix-hairpin-helix domain-containing protein [Geothermobacter hydrogeniphilus]PNU21558.1 hypothetical protein C2E25_01465 [Geothermobacter hydrogeniphilus]
MLPTRKSKRDGGRLLGLLLLVLIATSFYRGPLLHWGTPSFVFDHNKLLISLGKGFCSPGIHQFSDASDVLSVISMTVSSENRARLVRELRRWPIRSGECLEFTGNQAQNQVLVRHWMPAAQRVVLGIPLHPDRMTESDWCFLSGVGPGLARRIVQNRQKYGDFRNFNGLQRVPGIGPAVLRKNSALF